MKDGKLTLEEANNGIHIKTRQGVFHIYQGCYGLEINFNGKIVWSSQNNNNDKLPWRDYTVGDFLKLYQIPRRRFTYPG